MTDCLAVPAGPGLGVELDEAAIHAVTRHRLARIPRVPELQEMRRDLTDRRHFAEQQLFDVQRRLERARVALEVVEHQLAALSADALEKTARRDQSETPVADRACAAARERLATMTVHAALAREAVLELERTKDELLDKLVG